MRHSRFFLINKPSSDLMTNTTFYREAETFIQTNVKRITDEFLSGRFPGNWHPLGFAVFDLGEVKGLGKLRFHMWPRGLRVALKGQPVIHSHPRDMCSYVIAGTFIDTLYHAKKTDKESSSQLQGFKLLQISDEESEIYPVSTWYEVISDEDRTINSGDFHHIPAGYFTGLRCLLKDLLRLY